MSRRQGEGRQAMTKARLDESPDSTFPRAARFAEFPPVLQRRLRNCIAAVQRISAEIGILRDPFDLLGEYQSRQGAASGQHQPFGLQLWVALDRLDQAFADGLSFRAADYAVPPAVSDAKLQTRSIDQQLPASSPFVASELQSAKERVGLSDDALNLALSAHREIRGGLASKARLLALSWDTKGVLEGDLAALDVLIDIARVEKHSPERLLSSRIQSAFQSQLGKHQSRGESDKYNHDEIRLIGSREGWNSARPRSSRRVEILDLIVKELNLIASIRGAQTGRTAEPVNLESVKKHLRRILDAAPKS